MSYQAVLVLLLAALGIVTLYLLWRRGLKGRTLLACGLAVALALLLRGLCMDFISPDYATFLTRWVAYFHENGGFAALRDSVGDYNVPYLYFLAAISYLDFPDLYAIKLLSVTFDLILAWGGLRLAACFCAKGSIRPVAVFCLLLVLPTVVLNGAYWGQCDVIYGAICLHALACALNGRPKLSVILLAVAFAFKLQTVFLIPLWCALLFARKVKLWHLALFPLSFAVTCLPALLLGKPAADILGVYMTQTTEYSAYLCMNASSLFALLSDGVSNPRLLARLGIAAALLLVLAVLGVLFTARRRLNAESLLLAGLIFATGIPLLLPHMHDRYFFLADVLTLCLACIRPRWFLPAVLVQCASLKAYHNYLCYGTLSYPAWGVLFVVLALVLLCVLLRRNLRAPARGAFPQS